VHHTPEALAADTSVAAVERSVLADTTYRQLLATNLDLEMHHSCISANLFIGA
jgi:hypothetical protein